MSFFEGFFLMGIMMIGVFIPRLLPMGLLAKRTISKNFQIWLSFIGELFLAKENLFLMAFAPVLVVAYFTKNLFATLLVGMILVAAMRYFNFFV